MYAILRLKEAKGTYTRILKVYRTRTLGDVVEPPILSLNSLEMIIKKFVQFSVCFETFKNIKNSELNEDNHLHLTVALFITKMFRDIAKISKSC